MTFKYKYIVSCLPLYQPKKVQKLYFSFNKVISMYICNIFTFFFSQLEKCDIGVSFNKNKTKNPKTCQLVQISSINSMPIIL